MRKKQTWIIIFAGAGFIYCLANILWPASFFCSTTGCEIYAKVTFLGLSLYWYGAAFFIALTGTCGYAYLRNSSGTIFNRLLLCGIIINCGLLIWQFLFIPCLSCLIVAGLLGTILLIHSRKKPFFWKTVWVFCFLIASFNILRIDLLGPKPVYGNADARIKLFISPSCDACRQMLHSVLNDKALLQETALFPVAKNDDDIIKLSNLCALLAEGKTLEDAVAGWDKGKTDKGGMRKLLIQAVSWRNKAFLVYSGYSQVPVLLTAKSDILEKEEKKADIWDMDILKKSPVEGCGFEKETCEES